MFGHHGSIFPVTTPAIAETRKTALNAVHRRLNARMVNFGGWDMPLEYSGILAEHEAVRTRAGLFDVSHMGEIEITGPGAQSLVQWVTCNNAAKLIDGQAQYSGLMTSRGTFVDDLLVHKISDTHYLLCVNASNQDADFDHIVANNEFDAKVDNTGSRYSQLAVQGPRAEEILQKLTRTALGADSLLSFCLWPGQRRGLPDRSHRVHRRRRLRNLLRAGIFGKIVGRPAESRRAAGYDSVRVWVRATRCAWKPGCAFTAMKSTTPPRRWEAGLGWICKMEKAPFLGSDVLAAQKKDGVPRKLVGFEMLDKRIGRDGYPVDAGGKQVGRVTSGGPSPSLKKNIGMAYVPPELDGGGNRFGN